MKGKSLYKDSTVRFKVREYQPDDFAEISMFWSDSGLGGPVRGDNEKTIDLTLKAGGKLFVLYNRMNDEIIGTSWLTHDHRRIYMHHFLIKPAYQGKGYSEMLMLKSKEYARLSGMQFKLEVHRDNYKAINLYKKWGFKYLGDYDVYIIRDYII